MPDHGGSACTVDTGNVWSATNGSCVQPFHKLHVDRRPALPEGHEGPGDTVYIDVNEIDRAVLDGTSPDPFDPTSRSDR